MHTKVVSFQVIHFKNPDPVTKEPREAIMIYALGEDGVIYEFCGQWLALPIGPDTKEHAPEPSPPRAELGNTQKRRR